GSEMIVDWLKHAFINKFNIMRPRLHSRFLDVLCKDYYTNVISHTLQIGSILTVLIGLWGPEPHEKNWVACYSLGLCIYSSLFPDLPDVSHKPSTLTDSATGASESHHYSNLESHPSNRRQHTD